MEAWKIPNVVADVYIGQLSSLDQITFRVVSKNLCYTGLDNYVG